MINMLIKKVIARDGEREIVTSSPEEMHKFVVEGIRPEFEDEKVICVKFLQATYEGDDEPGESPWYINPQVCRDSEGNPASSDDYYAYGPKMDSEFVPEILLAFHDTDEVIKRYDAFNKCLLITGEFTLSEKEKLEKFIESYNELDC